MGEVQRLGASLTTPALSPAELDDMNAALIEHFDPVRMTLPQIEAMQAMLAQAAARHRAEEEGDPEVDVHADFVQLTSSDFKACGEVEGLTGRDELLERFNPGEDAWRSIGSEDGA